jgi:protein transport protein SEC31
MQFTCLDWETFGEKDKFPYGIIVSGFSDGSVALWDANTIVSSRGGENDSDVYQKGLLCLQNVHSGPVHSIAFNPFKQHLIASGGSEVVIHNLEENIADPECFSPGDNLHQGSPITDVSWNRKVPHILASASQNGIAVLWDLKMNKSIFNFSDNNKHSVNRKVSLSWNPEIPTQIGIVYDDERNPELQIWDLRNPQGPIFASQRVHNKGIHSMDWCLTDSSLISTLGRDNRICFWNYKAEDSLVGERHVNEPSTKIKFSPRLPAVYSVTNQRGGSTIFSMNDDSQLDNNQLATYAPRWLKPPVGARFSFDGKLVVFSEKSGV